MKLLIVDDNRPMRQMLKTVLSEVAPEIYEASDGGEAIESYKQHQPDWVLMDIQMKSLDGIAATRQIRNQFPGARILILTSHDDAELRCAAEEAGACGYVLKENLLELRQTISSQTTTQNQTRII